MFSTATHVLRAGPLGAGDEARTRDLRNGNAMLYQLSYTCISKRFCAKRFLRIWGSSTTRGSTVRLSVIHYDRMIKICTQ